MLHAQNVLEKRMYSSIHLQQNKKENDEYIPINNHKEAIYQIVPLYIYIYIYIYIY